MTGVTGIVLAGGQGRRMGGVDKGLQPLRGRAMVEWVLERLAPQVDEIVINANQNLEAYARFGHRVVADEVGGFAGPLAGLHAGLRAAAYPPTKKNTARVCSSHDSGARAGMEASGLASRSTGPARPRVSTSAVTSQ